MYFFYFLLAVLILTVDALTIEEQFCGVTECTIADYNFVLQQTIDLTTPTPVSTLAYGNFTAVVGVSNVAKNNLVLASTNAAVVSCPTSRGLMFEVGGIDTTPLASVAFSQLTADSCIVDFDSEISAMDLLKPLYLVLALDNDIVSATSSLDVQMSLPIVSITAAPTDAPSTTPTTGPTGAPSTSPTTAPSSVPSTGPTEGPTTTPSTGPTALPTTAPSTGPTEGPTTTPSTGPTEGPTTTPSTGPTTIPSTGPTEGPTTTPSTGPTEGPTTTPSTGPTTIPSTGPSAGPTAGPTTEPTDSPTTGPSAGPTTGPTDSPTTSPTSSPIIFVPSSLEVDICGGVSCSIQDYNFFTQQSIDLTVPNSAVTSPKYGTLAAVIAVDNAAKNNFIFFSANNAPLICSGSRALLYESQTAETLPLSNVVLSQLGTSSCLANFSTAISTVDLQKNLHFVLTVDDSIKTATPALGVQISTPIIPGSRPIHVWVGAPDPNSATGVLMSLNIKINSLPMIASGCLSTTSGLNLQMLQANDVVDPQCKFTPDTAIISTNDNTIFLEKMLTQNEYWTCANSVTFPNSVLTFVLKVVPDFDGCTYYQHRSYNPYLFNVFVQYILTQGPFGLVITQSTTTMDI